MKQFYWKMAMIVIILAICMNASGYDFEVNGIFYGYNASDQTAFVTYERWENSYSGDIVIPSSVIYQGKEMAVNKIGDRAFFNCTELHSVVIPHTIEEIGEYAFDGCTGLTLLKIPNSVKYIKARAIPSVDKLIFEDGDDGLNCNYWNGTGRKVYLGRNIYMQVVVSADNMDILSVSPKAKTIPYENANKLIFCMSDHPESIKCSFINKTYINTILYVPTGTKEKYLAADGWKNFFNIQEMDVADMWDGKGEPPSDDETKKKCEKPTIRYSNGKLLFESATEGAICQSTITDSDITSYSGNEIQLGVTYNISVYATAEGYENSDTVTATLCWIDVNPKTEGIENSVSQVRARAILIQTNNGTLNISGVEDGTDIDIYTSSGMMVGSAKVSSESTSINTGFRNGDIAIVKIGDKAVKVVMK